MAPANINQPYETILTMSSAKSKVEEDERLEESHKEQYEKTKKFKNIEKYEKEQQQSSNEEAEEEGGGEEEEGEVDEEEQQQQQVLYNTADDDPNSVDQSVEWSRKR